jgi:hypothetical protein
MISNNDILNIVNVVINRDLNGASLNKDDYEAELNAQSLRLFNSKLPQVGITKKVDKDLSPFFCKVTKVAVRGSIDLTAENPAFIASMIPNPFTARGFDEVTAGELPDRLMNAITEPTLSDPIIVIGGDNRFDVYPSGILGATIMYYKYPSKATVVYTHDPVTLRPIYDPSSVELEWSDTCKIDLAYMILRDAGMNVNRHDIEQFADSVVKSGK